MSPFYLFEKEIIMKHNWAQFEVEGEFSAVVCNTCGFVVLASLKLPGVEKNKSYYYKSHRLIVWGDTNLTPGQADKLCAHYKAQCDKVIYARGSRSKNYY